MTAEPHVFEGGQVQRNEASSRFRKFILAGRPNILNLDPNTQGRLGYPRA